MRDTANLEAADGPLGAAAVGFVADQAIVALSGEHDMATIDAVERAFAVAEAASTPLIVVDLSDCSFVDSTIVRALLLARERAAESGRRVVLVHTTVPIIATMLDISGLNDIFESFETVDEALEPPRSGPTS